MSVGELSMVLCSSVQRVLGLSAIVQDQHATDPSRKPAPVKQHSRLCHLMKMARLLSKSDRAGKRFEAMSSVTASAAPDPFDPSELAKLRLSQDFAELSQVKPVITSVACRKPHKQEFIRVLEGDSNRFTTGCFTDKDSRETYLVSPAVRELLVGDVVPTLLVVCISRNSPIPFLWPLTLPSNDGRPNRWHESELEAANIAEHQWVKVVADMSAGCYLSMVAVGKLADPDWSEVPTIAELLKLSFKDRFIAAADHPVLKRLRGES